MKSESTTHRPGPQLLRALLLSLISLLPTPGHAQDSARPAGCRVLGTEGATPPGAPLCSGGKGGNVPCTVPANAPSAATVCFTKGDKLNFLSATDRKPVATATIPATVKSAILLFLPAAQAQAPLPWRVFVINDSPKTFPDGGAFVANFYHKDIRFIIGEHRILLRPATSHACVRPTQRDDFNMAQVAFEFQQEESWRSVSETLLRFLPDMRYLVIAYVDPTSGRPRLFVSTDLAPAPVPPPPK